MPVSAIQLAADVSRKYRKHKETVVSVETEPSMPPKAGDDTGGPQVVRVALIVGAGRDFDEGICSRCKF